MSNNCRKAINFDLDTNALKEYYPGKNYRDAYYDIKDFLYESGFEHRQWSGYVSVKPMLDSTIRAKVLKLRQTFPWLEKCVNRFDVTDIGEQHDLTYLFTGETKGITEMIEQSLEDSLSGENKSIERSNSECTAQSAIGSSRRVGRPLNRGGRGR